MSGLPDPLKYKKFFSQFNGDFDNQREIETYDNLMAEYAGIKGIPIHYFPICVDTYKEGMDPVYGENSRPRWDRKYDLTGIVEEFSLETVEFEGRGMVNTDEITLYVHRSTFDKHIGIRTNTTTDKTIERRGAWGPVAKDMVKTVYNGLIYEVTMGGLHFLTSEAQHFGHKFWYKITCKIREVSDATVGEGEQYGAFPDNPLDPQYKGNPQFLMPTPSLADLLANTGTREQVGTPSTTATTGECVNINYVTTGSAPGPSDGTVPPDILLPDGRVSSKYQVPGLKEGSLGGDQREIGTKSDEVVDPQTNLVTETGSEENTKYGPQGTIINNPKRTELFGDW